MQYRLRVRQRLMVQHFAWLFGTAAAGRRLDVSVRTIRAGGPGGGKTLLKAIERGYHVLLPPPAACRVDVCLDLGGLQPGAIRNLTEHAG